MFYFDFSTWRRMVRLAWRETNRRNRTRLLVTLLVQVPLVASFHAICFALDPLLFPSLRRTRVRTPVFILGHARSGTTLLHRLMSRDADRFSAFLLYELFFPSLLQKRAIRFFAACDARLLGGAIERRIRAWEARKFGKTRHLHPMGLTEPEEDDGVLTYSCASGSWIVRLPYLGELDFYHVDERPARERRRVMRFYAECVRRQLCLNGGDRIHLSKNPLFAGRVESLIETFPDARFVVPFRNPYETIPSLLKLMKVAWKMRRWSDDEMQRSLRVLAEQSYHTYRHPLEVLARHPETRRGDRRLRRAGGGAPEGGGGRLRGARLPARCQRTGACSTRKSGRRAGTRRRIATIWRSSDSTPMRSTPNSPICSSASTGTRRPTQ